jgi:hypothetical protein
MSHRVRVTEARLETSDELANLTVSLDNHQTYQLRVVTDSVGNVWVWIDHRSEEWQKLAEIKNGERIR